MKVGDKVLYNGKEAEIIATDGVGLGQYKLYVIDSYGAYSITVDSCDLYKYDPAANQLINDFFEKETVAKPKRYNSGSIEVWDAIQKLGLDYLQGNVLKYTARYKHKNKAEDLKKAMNYLAKMLAEETGEDYYELRKKSLDEL